MIIDLVNEAITKSMRHADEQLVKHRAFLRFIKGELQMAETRQNKALTDEQQSNVLKKILKSNEETLATLATTDDRFVALTEENALLNGLLPNLASNDEIKAALTVVLEQIKAAKNEGQAMGLAMKTLKEAKVICEGNTVKEIVNEMRA